MAGTDCLQCGDYETNLQKNEGWKCDRHRWAGRYPRGYRHPCRAEALGPSAGFPEILTIMPAAHPQMSASRIAFSKRRGPAFAAILGVVLAVSMIPQPVFAKTHHKPKTKTVRTIRLHHHGRIEVVRKQVLIHYGPPVRNFTTVVIDAGHGGQDNGGIFG